MKEIDVECSRVSGILNELIMSLDFASRIPEDRHHAHPVIVALHENGHEAIAGELERLVHNEAEYREAMRARGGKSSGHLPIGGGSVVHVDDTGTRLGMRAVASAFRSDPEALSHLPQPLASCRKMGDFMVHVSLLSDVMMRRLQTSKARQADDALELANRQRRIDEGENEITRITEALRKQRIKHRKELSELEEREKSLHKELAASTASSEDALRSVQTAGSTRESATRENFAGSTATNTAELEKAQVDYKVLCESHGEAEAALRKNLLRRRLECETAMREFDAVVGSLQAKLMEALDTKTETAALEDYLQYFARVDKEKAVIEEERLQEERDHLVGVTLRDAVRDMRIRSFILPFVLRQKKRLAE